MSSEQNKAAIVRDAAWFAHRYESASDTVSFVHADRAAHRAAPFLRDNYLPESDAPVSIDRREAVAAAPAGAPIHFIFHTGYCCSTLVARAFDVPGVAMGLKEPLILNDLSVWSLDGAEPARVEAVLDDSLTLLARPFAPGEAVIVKPSNVPNNLIGAILRLRPEAKAVLMYAPLRAYLPSIASKGMDGRAWVRMLHNNLVKEGRLKLDFTMEQFMELTDLQVAALGWMAQQLQMQALALHFGRERVATLSSETLLADPSAAITALDRLFGTGMDADAIDAIVTGPTFARNAKTGETYSPAQRAAEREATMAVYGGEIEVVANWAEKLAGRTGVAMALAAPL
ncbi:MAG: hypothetical protein H0X36_11610 [Sphingomonadaceae bacterium]|nr:hypothetical protein [Sphingomonadaceae bacterium]